MCAAAVNSTLFFLTLTILTILFKSKMIAEGLPIFRQERGADRGVLAGADFLSVFMSSAYPRKISTHDISYTKLPLSLSTSSPIESEDIVERQTSPHLRQVRSTDHYSRITKKSHIDLDLTTSRAQFSNDPRSSDNSVDGVIVAVRVSSSVGTTLVNKQIHDNHRQTESTISVTRDTTENSIPYESKIDQITVVPDQELVPSEERISIIAEANKSDFSVDESEPITSNSELPSPNHDIQAFSVKAQTLPRPQNLPLFSATSQYLPPKSDSTADKTKFKPHQSFIYHDNPRDQAQARSVSYSSIIQEVPQVDNEKRWDGEKLTPHERQERHYDNSRAGYFNAFKIDDKNSKTNFTSQFSGAQVPIDRKIPFVAHTSLPKESNWENPERAYFETSTTKLLPEQNWENQEKAYRVRPRPTYAYGIPEQNYEVDEAVSINSNGRAHGVQSTQKGQNNKNDINSKKVDDNQKVGYVVEGRNFRKYRVEERTSDGFIVGEYGVVSHNDGSLRGVRYTADGTTNPRLIYDALMKFLSL